MNHNKSKSSLSIFRSLPDFFTEDDRDEPRSGSKLKSSDSEGHESEYAAPEVHNPPAYPSRTNGEGKKYSREEEWLYGLFAMHMGLPENLENDLRYLT